MIAKQLEIMFLNLYLISTSGRYCLQNEESIAVLDNSYFFRESYFVNDDHKLWSEFNEMTQSSV